jgi:NDP-sugar pyrophosphorylase family protein
MKAMILAGGLSTRLYPLTRQVPKPLVPIDGEPNSAHVMRYLRSFGIEDVAINVHYLANAIAATFGNGSAYGVKLEYLHEAKLLGSAGAVKQMEHYFDETFVVVGCDDLTDLRLDALVDFHRKRGALATIALVQAEDVSHYGVVVVDDAGRIVEFQEKPARGTEKSHLVNTGIYVFEPEIFKLIPAGEFYDFGKQVFPQLQSEKAAFYGLELHGAYWCDIGTPGEYRRATNDVLSGKVRLPGARAKGIPPDAKLGDDVLISGDVRIGARAKLGNGVRVIGPSVIGDAVFIGDGAVVERSIVWDRVTIGQHAHIVDSIVGVGYEVAPGHALRDAIVANEGDELI